MIIALFLAAAVCVSIASVALAWSHVARVRAAARTDIESLVMALKRVRASERAQILVGCTLPGEFEHELAREILAATSDEARIAAVNLALADVEHVFQRTSSWPPAALRILLLSAGLLAFALVLGDAAKFGWSFVIVGVGAVGALACVEARRCGEREAMLRRRAIDDLVAALGLLEERGPPKRPRLRSRGRWHSS